MALFVRLQTSFWTHRKTMRLRAKIGDAALWLPPRIWSYAAESQPDGDFKDYSAEEIAMLLGYLGDAQAMLIALQESGFMDGMSIHDWEQYNGYHQKYSERAKKAANARWKGKGKDKRVKGEEKRREEKRQALLDDATSMPQALLPENLANDLFRDAWDRWGEYRKQARLKKYTDIGAKTQITKLSEIGSERAIRAIENSIANAYQGIFEPKEGNGSRPNHKQPTKEENERSEQKYGW